LFCAGALVPAVPAWAILASRKARGPGVWARAFRPLVIAAMTVLVLLWPWVGHGGVAACDAAFEHKQAVWGVSQEMLGDNTQSKRNQITIQGIATIVVMLLAVACLSVDHEPSSFTWKAVWSVGFFWLLVLGDTLENMLSWCDWGIEESPGIRFVWGASCGGHSCGVIIILSLVWQRLVAFEEVLCLLVGSKVIIQVTGLSGLLMVAAFSLGVFLGQGETFLMYNTALIVFGFVCVFIGVGYISALMSRPLRALWSEARISKGVARRQTTWAANVLLGELIAIYIALISSGLKFLMAAIGGDLTGHMVRESGWNVWNIWVCSILDTLSNILGLVILSGLWHRRTSPSLVHFAERIRRRVERKASSRTSAVTVTRSYSLRSGALSADERTALSAKVDELAHRGVRLESLLDFYARDLLGLDGGTRCMPSFRPAMSTTRDVVREAIIPVSRFSDGSGGEALATKWNRGERVRAEKMVTHAWSNFFTDLVAAIVAEALGQDRYIEAAGLLAEGRVEELKGRLRDAGTLQQVYWVCAFSINQHAGICGDFGPEPREPGPRHDIWAESRLNTVSKEVYPLCPCREPKYFNDAPVPCELNKFDDMMALLSAGDGLRHVVAMDRKFALLTRVWCLAEVAESAASRIPQTVLICDDGCIDAEYRKLKRLDIRECEATRQEDKDEILASIPDIDVFNESLQELVMGDCGLLSKFTVREAKLRNAAKFMRRVLEIR